MKTSAGIFGIVILLIAGSVTAADNPRLRIYEGVNIEQVTEFLEDSLIDRRFDIWDIDVDDDGDTVVECQRNLPTGAWFGGPSTMTCKFRLKTDDGNVVVNGSCNAQGAFQGKDGYGSRALMDTTARVKSEGGKAWCKSKNNEKTFACKF